MANNLMWLVNDETGTRVLIAKYYPSTGWFSPNGTQKRMDEAFDLSGSQSQQYFEYEEEPLS